MFIQRGNNNFDIQLADIPVSPFTNTYSLDFDGIDDKVDCGTIPHFTTSQNTFSVSFWFKNTTVGGNAINIGGKIYFVMGSNRIECWNLGNVNGRADTTAIIFGNTWHNLTYIFDGSGATNEDRVKVYVDGVLNSVIYQNTQPTSTTATSVSTFISASPFGAYYNGNVDEVSIFDSAINIADVWDGSGQPTDLTDLNPIAWYRNGDNGSYKSPQWLIPSNENKDKVSNYSFDFDGVDDYVNIPNNTDLNFSSAYSVSFWIKTTSAALLSPISNQSKFLIRLYAPANQIRLQLYDGSNGFLNLDNTQVFNDGNWHHIAFTTEATTTADKVIVYFDGVALTNKGTQLNVGSHLSAFAYEIGRNSGTWNFNGGIDEVSIYDSELSASEINDIYNGGEPTTIPSGAVAHYKLGEKANFTSNWLVDNSALSNYSKRSFEFDGVDDYISVSDNSIGQTQNISYSIWVNLNVTTDQWIIGNQSSSNGGAGLAVKAGALIFQMADGTNDSYFNSRVTSFSTYAPINTWNHILATWDGTDSKIYINGVLRNTWSPTLPYTISSYDTTFNIGWRNAGFSQMTNGKLDELALFDSAISIGDVWDGSGQPIDVSAVSGITNNWRMGEDASFNGTNWTIPDNVGSSTGTSANMTVDDLVGEAPNYSGGGISSGMTIEDRIGEAPNSTDNALSFNMESVDRTTDVPT